MVENGRFERLETGPGFSPASIFGVDGLGRVMVIGAPGSGKSTLAFALASAMDRVGPARGAQLLALDPGSPHIGPPGAANLFLLRAGQWRLVHSQAVCSLDAARFRMPLALAAEALMALVEKGLPLILDMPGVFRGAAAAELFWSMARMTQVDTVAAISSSDQEPPLASELAACGLKVFLAPEDPAATAPSKKSRAIHRTALWDDYLKEAAVIPLNARNVPIVGNPPPIEAPETWPGRQIALLDSFGSTISMGEILTFAPGGAATARVRPFQGPWASLLVRDARRGEDGLLRTSGKKSGDSSFISSIGPDMTPPALARRATAPCYPARVGQADVILLNGLFGDPLLHLRLRDQRRSLLFDLGEATRLQARIAHQVTDVFISHAHMDHIGGFLWLLRSRIGLFPPCRLYGPPGLCAHIQGMLDGILWDRIADRGPVFIISEIEGGKVTRLRVQAGAARPEPMGVAELENGIILGEAAFTIRCALLDHGVPCIAYSFEQPAMLNVRKDALSAGGLPSGKWLGDLKLAIMRGQPDLPVAPPGHPAKKAGDWAETLLLSSPGVKMVYATDLGDTPENRERLIGLAQGADLMFLEASFLQEDKDQANATWHLTATACGRMAKQAGVKRLAPFHLSRRYEKNPEAPLAQVRAEFPGILTP